MRSAFNNVVHLEGLLEGTRSRGSGPDGRRVTLFISVRRDIYDDKGNRDVRDEPHEMSVDRRASRTVTELKKGTPVSIDGSLTLKPIVLGSEEHLVSHVTANRVQVLMECPACFVPVAKRELDKESVWDEGRSTSLSRW